jgi:hypothetical protein
MVRLQLAPVYTTFQVHMNRSEKSLPRFCHAVYPGNREKLCQFIFASKPQPFPKTLVESVHNRHAAEAARPKPPAERSRAGIVFRTGWKEGVMGSMRNWMLGAVMVAGAAALGTTQAQAAEFGVYVRGPVAYVPPCPGPGYFWTAGYINNGYRVPGYWHFRGVGPVVRYDRGFDRHFVPGRGYERFRR